METSITELSWNYDLPTKTYHIAFNNNNQPYQLSLDESNKLPDLQTDEEHFEFFNWLAKHFIENELGNRNENNN
ncbi:MAG: hypothetical protein QM737_22710 [Ferruginibacter sp.]